jgi:hypothetical protein
MLAAARPFTRTAVLLLYYQCFRFRRPFLGEGLERGANGIGAAAVQALLMWYKKKYVNQNQDMAIG